MRRGKGIAVLYPYSNLDTVPSLCAALESLASSHLPVDIFMPMPTDFRFPSFANPNIRVIAVPYNSPPRTKFSHSKGMPHRFLRHRFLRPVKSLLGRFVSISLHPLARKILQYHLTASYRCIIGVDPHGVTRADPVARLLRVPIIYWSLELLLSYEVPNDWWRRLKEQERMASQRAAFVVIQDEERARLMASDNGIPWDRFLFIPNAPLGPVDGSPSHYWHSRLDLSPKQRVVLHAGSLTSWTGIKDIVASVRDWPGEWVLVVHSRYKSNDKSILQELRSLDKTHRVIFSTEPALRAQYTELVRGAKVGIAFYYPVYGSPYTQENIRMIGLSSGKIAYYLWAGLPVIINRWPSLSELIEQERCGVVVNTAAEIRDALSTIDRHCEEYSRNAHRVFERYFDPSKGIQRLVDRLHQLEENENANH